MSLSRRTVLWRSEEHTSELQSQSNIVCRLLLEKKNVILLADQADVSAAADMKDQDARGWFVFNTLTQHAARTQVGLQELLKSQGVPYQSFWAANMLVANVDRKMVNELAARADVARVDSNRPVRWIEDPVVEKFG